MLGRGLRLARQFSAPAYRGIDTKAGTTVNMTFTSTGPQFPVLRFLDTDGKPVKGAELPELEDDEMVKMYRTMVQSDVIDHVLYDSQRQGRISFYMTNYGEEASHVGSASALDNGDVIYAQYRESGVLMWRGFSIADMCNQCFSNHLDVGKGRQMPVHYGSRELNFHTISSPLGTQIPQAAGAGLALKRAGKSNVAVCYFGDGAASEGDFHAALNIAATMDSPTLFIVRNNGYAISTPVEDQYRGDGIAARGPGYGIPTIRVDGNDVLAMRAATAAARDLSVRESRPVLIEAMTYRIGHHSTSDDSSRYRDAAEVDAWRENNDPMFRFRTFLVSRGLWDDERETALREELRADVIREFRAAAARKKPSFEELFRDVYDEVPPHLQRQRKELLAHLDRNPDHYKDILASFHEDSE